MTASGQVHGQAVQSGLTERSHHSSAAGVAVRSLCLLLVLSRVPALENLGTYYCYVSGRIMVAWGVAHLNSYSGIGVEGRQSCARKNQAHTQDRPNST